MISEDYKCKKIIKDLRCTLPTLQLYLCRPEFSHITKVREDKEHYLLGLTRFDMLKLKKLINRRNKSRGRR